MYYDSFAWMGILIYLAIIAISLLVTYFIIRLAVFHAMKSHTRWLQSGGR